METVLMHTCCAPCSLSCIEPLRSEGIEPVAFWYNPNIHPWKEYEARRDCLLGYAPSIGMEVRVREEYGLRPFVEAVAEAGRVLAKDETQAAFLRRLTREQDECKRLARTLGAER